MAAVRGANTKPEMTVRAGLHRRGFRYCLHGRGLVGKPDLVFPKHQAVLFVHGCFWHAHSCALFKLPETRREFWLKKLRSNARRDFRVQTGLAESGWRVGVIWECALRGGARIAEDEALETVARWLRGNRRSLVVSGRPE
jgi:DNA mismatch endonuclease (patch repair protein)